MMNKSNGIIEGSEKWIERIPDQYAIQHVEAYISPIEQDKMILKFSYVKNCCGAYGAGFVNRVGLLKVMQNIGEFIDGIIILQNDLSEQPSVYFKTKHYITYNGHLSKCEIDNIVYEPLKFTKVIHYSGRNSERQKSDPNAPKWLKKFAIKSKSNVAYFEF